MIGSFYSYTRRAIAILVAAGLLAAAAPSEGRTLLKNICRVKGQEENTLQGLGLVIGLKGSGDGANSWPTIRSLAQAIQLMGAPTDSRSLANPREYARSVLKDDVKNVALVMVTATVPGAGARQGDTLDCTVSSVGGAKSLAGGQLFITAMQGPVADNPRVYAFAQGPITLADPKVAGNIPTNGKVFRGCRLEQDFFNQFVKDGKITLVLNKDHADFQVAEDVAELINGQFSIQTRSGELARAINQENIEILIPPQYRDRPVSFVSQVLSLPMLDPQTAARVVINERAGSIVISGEVEIGAVVISHRNMVIDTTGGQPDGGAAAGGSNGPPPSHFVPLETSATPTPKLRALVETLNTLKVPNEDVIEIIKGLERTGKLHGQLIIE